MPTVAAEPSRPLLQDLTHPVQCLHVVFKRGSIEQSNFSDIRRAQTRLTALALNRFDHRRLFTANVGTCTTTQMDRRNWKRWVCLQSHNLSLKNGAATMIFVTQININLSDVNRPRRDQCTLKKAMWIALEVIPILEGTRLPFVDVDGQQPRCGLGRN